MQGADGNQQPSRARTILPSVTSPWEKEWDVTGSQSALS